MGSSSPHFWRVSSILAGLAPIPAMAMAGSPGRRRRRVNVSNVTANSTITSWMSRCLRKCIGSAPPTLLLLA